MSPLHELHKQLYSSYERSPKAQHRNRRHWLFVEKYLRLVKKENRNGHR
jgi:hypothetical protein